MPHHKPLACHSRRPAALALMIGAPHQCPWRPPEGAAFRVLAASRPASLRLLQDMRLRYVLINLARYSDEDRRRIKQSLASTPHGRIIAQVDGWTVFALQ